MKPAGQKLQDRKTKLTGMSCLRCKDYILLIIA
jgi:hypothetical protein